MSEKWYVAFVNGTELDFDGFELTLNSDDIDDLIEDGLAEELDDILDGMRVVVPKKGGHFNGKPVGNSTANARSNSTYARPKSPSRKRV